MSVSREKLFEEVWAEPMTTVAARYRVSSSFLARICARLGVPRPGRGHWAKLEVGKKPKQPSLPEVRPGDELEWSRDGQARRAPQVFEVQSAIDVDAKPQRRRKYSRHPLLMGAREHFEAARETYWGVFPRPAKRLLVDICVSKETLDRSLSFANKLFLALEDCGHRVVLAPRGEHWIRPSVDHREKGGVQQGDHGWYPERPTVVYTGTVAIGLTLYELSEEADVAMLAGKDVRVSPREISRLRFSNPHAYVRKKDIASGRFALRAFSPYPRTSWEKEWREAKPRDLNRKFDEIGQEIKRAAPTIVSLVEDAARKAEVERQIIEARQRQWAEEQAERRRQEAEQRRIQARNASRDHLVSLVDSWALACRVEQFFKKAAEGTASFQSEDQAVVLNRLQAARQLLGGVEPLEHFRKWKSPEEL